MKQLYAIFLIIVCALAASPCVEARRGLDQAQSEKLFSAKMKMMQEKLKLTDEQTEKLIPMYRNYLGELDDIFKSRRFHRRFKPSTTQEACDAVTERLDIDSRVIDLQKKYIIEFSKILNADQLMNIYRVEAQIQREIRQEFRRRSHSGNPPKG